MEPSTLQMEQGRWRVWTAGGGVVMALAGGLGLAGWIAGIPVFTTILPGLASMKPNAAVGLLLAGLGTTRLVNESSLRAARTRRVLALAVLVLGLVTVVEFLFAITPGIDEIIAHVPPRSPANPAPARMAPMTAASLVLFGVALWFGTRHARGWRALLAHGCAMLLALMSGLALLGYLYDVEALYRVYPFSSVALHTALATLAGTAALLAGGPTVGIMRLVRSSGAGGVIVRRLAPAIVVAPLALGAFAVAGRRAGWFDGAFDPALGSVCTIGFLAGLLWWTATHVERLDRSRTATTHRAEHLAEQLHTTLRSIGDGVITTDVAGRVTYLNPAAEALTGWTCADARNQFIARIFDIHDETSGAVTTSPIAEALRTRAVVELANHTVLRRRDGAELPIEDTAAPIRTPDGELHGAVLIFHDVTHRRRAEADHKRMALDLEHSNECFRLAAEATGSMIYETDLTTGVTRWSDGLMKALGYGHDDAAASWEWWVERIHPEDRERVRRAREEAIAKSAGFSSDYRVRRAGGDYADILDYAVIGRDAQGLAVRMVGSAQDVSERKRLEERLFKSRRLESIGRLAGGVAHDFNNLITVMLGHVELASQTHDQSAALTESLTNIRRAAERAARLTSQLLAFARKNVVDPRVMDLNRLVSDVDAMLRPVIGDDIKLTTRLGEGLGRVRIDPGQFENILMNLAVNARDAMPGGGSLTISTFRTVVPSNDPRSGADEHGGKYFVLEVKDTGAGMDHDTVTRLFEPFFTTKTGGRGTGLGLASSYGAVRRAGGFLTVDTAPGAGTTFRVHLPEVDEPESVTPAREEVGAVGGSETVIVVEDDVMVHEIVVKALRSRGFKVIAARNGGEALRLVTEHARPIDLLLTDLVMPGMSGIDLAKELRERRPNLRVLFMSGYSEQEIPPPDAVGPGDAFLPKPFTASALARRVREVLDARSSAPAAESGRATAES